MKPLIRRILREQTDPTFTYKVWDAVNDVGKFALKNNGLSWLIRKVVGTTPTKARLIFPKEGWETIAVKILEHIGVVTGTYETLNEANNFFKDLYFLSVDLKYILSELYLHCSAPITEQCLFFLKIRIPSLIVFNLLNGEVG